VLDSEVLSIASDDHRERNVDLRPLIRQAQVGPRGQRTIQGLARRVAVTGRGCDQTPRSQRSCHSPRLVGSLSQAFQPDSGRLCCGGVLSSQPGPHQESEPSPQHYLMAAEQLEPLLEQARRPSPITLG
jgi:hypothetical protein